MGSRCNPELPLQMAAEAGAESAARCATPPWPPAESCIPDPARIAPGRRADGRRNLFSGSPRPRPLLPPFPSGETLTPRAPPPPQPRRLLRRPAGGTERECGDPSSPAARSPRRGANAVLTSPDGAVPANLGKVGAAGGAPRSARELLAGFAVAIPFLRRSRRASRNRGDGRGGIKTRTNTHTRASSHAHTHKSTLNSFLLQAQRARDKRLLCKVGGLGESPGELPAPVLTNRKANCGRSPESWEFHKGFHVSFMVQLKSLLYV